MNKLITAIIAARMSSSRLPGKTMFKIQGKSILELMIDRMKLSKRLNKIVVATSVNNSDDVIVNFCREHKIECYRGPEDDLLARYKMISDIIDTDIIAKFGADCPLIDPLVIDTVIDIYLQHDYDYISNYGPPPRTYPEGMTLDVYSSELLTQAYIESRRPSEREHISPFFCNHPERYSIHRVDYKKDISKYRLALDYYEDFKLIETIFNEFLPQNNFTLEEIVDYLNNNPEVHKINSHIKPNQGLIKSLEEDKKYGF